MKSLNKNKIVLFDIDYTLFDTQTFKNSSLTKFSLYIEVLPVLESLVNIAELGIFSKGNDIFQNIKLQETGIIKFFQEQNIHVFENKDINLKHVIEKYNSLKIYLIDDNLATLYNAKKNTPLVTTVWIKRGPFAEDVSLLNNFIPDFVRDNLEEIVPIVSGYFK
jgi:FMN phosphatase YigB (HAD superfamily)